jgi:putative peptidoglycan lipid II flippase
MSKATLAKAAGMVAFLTVVSKVLGFFREASLAKVFGATSATDAYLVAQTIPFLFFSMVSYALTTTFIPVYAHTREEGGQEAALGFANTVIWAVLALGLLFVVIGEVLAAPLVRLVAPGFEGEVADLTVYLSRIMFPMMVFQLSSGVMTGILQADGEFAVSTAADLLRNVAIITSILVFGPNYGVAAVAAGTLAGAALAMVVKLLFARRLGFYLTAGLDTHDTGLRRIGMLMLPAVIGAGAGQLNTLVDRILASRLPEGRVAALSYADRLMQLAPGIVGAPIVTVTYPTLAKLAAREEWAAFNAGLIDALSLLHFLLAPIAVGVLVLREPLVRIVYERGVFDAAATQQTASALLFLSLGIAVFTMLDLVRRAFFTIQDTATPMVLGSITVGVNIALNFLLVGRLEQGGLALATTSASLVGLILALWALRRKFPAGLPMRRLMSSVWRVGLAAAVMGSVVCGVYAQAASFVRPRSALIELTLVVLAAAVGTGMFVGLVWLLRVPELSVVSEAARRGLAGLRCVRQTGGNGEAGRTTE